MAKQGILLVNLGTPKSPKPSHVYRYLQEFLLDGRVIDFPAIPRNLLVRGIIVPFRHRKSAAMYRKVWTDRGSPLLYHGEDVADKLQKRLGDDYKVVLAMRYQEPSIKRGLEALRDAKVERITVMPLFPQYASATTGSVHDKVMEILRTWQAIPDVQFINSYFDHPSFIKAFAKRGAQYNWQDYDHVIFSFHGLPERQIHKGDDHNVCRLGDCCQQITPGNQFCYRAQCFGTANAIAAELGIPQDRYTVAFQSRLGRAEWIKPYSEPLVEELAQKGAKKLLMFSPAFVADCLETIFEIGEEYLEVFQENGGEHLQLVESLNSSDTWIDAMLDILRDKAAIEVSAASTVG